MEVAAGMESTAAAVSAAAALGVKSDPADAFALDVAAAERGVADAAHEQLQVVPPGPDVRIGVAGMRGVGDQGLAVELAGADGRQQGAR